MATDIIPVVEKPVAASAVLADHILIVIGGKLYRTTVETLSETLTQGEIEAIRRASDEIIEEVSARAVEEVERQVEEATAELIATVSAEAVSAVKSEVESQISQIVESAVVQIDALKDEVSAYADSASADADRAEEVADSIRENSKLVAITIPADSWICSDDYTGEAKMYGYYYIAEVPVDNCTAIHFADVALLPESISKAISIGMSSACETGNGVIRFWSQKPSDTDLKADVSLRISPISESAPEFVIPAASETNRGGVIVKQGSGLNVTANGELSIDSATIEAISKEFGTEGGND